MTPPLWLLDVDGVLNAVSAKPPPEQMTGWSRDAWRSLKVAMVPILAAEPVLDHVRRAVATGVDVRWLTTWEDGAPRMLAPELGLPELPVAGRAREEEARVGPRAARAYSFWWKLPVVQRLVAEDPSRRVVWTDDDIAHHPPTQRWLREGGADHVLPVSPRTDLGLTQRHMTVISGFLLGAQVAAASDAAGTVPS